MEQLLRGNKESKSSMLSPERGQRDPLYPNADGEWRARVVRC